MVRIYDYFFLGSIKISKNIEIPVNLTGVDTKTLQTFLQSWLTFSIFFPPQSDTSIPDFTRLPQTATLASAIPAPNTACKVFQAYDLMYNPTSLVLWEVGAVVVNCDILIGSGTPTNFSDGPLHFCAELEVLDHVQPETVLDAQISRTCDLYQPPLEVD